MKMADVTKYFNSTCRMFYFLRSYLFMFLFGVMLWKIMADLLIKEFNGLYYGRSEIKSLICKIVMLIFWESKNTFVPRTYTERKCK